MREKGGKETHGETRRRQPTVSQTLSFFTPKPSVNTPWQHGSSSRAEAAEALARELRWNSPPRGPLRLPPLWWVPSGAHSKEPADHGPGSVRPTHCLAPCSFSPGSGNCPGSRGLWLRGSR